MVAENIQLEHYEVAVSSSALKQLTWQIDPVTPAESTGSYKAQSGVVLTLISKEKVIELIASGVASATSVYVISNTEEDCRELLELDIVINIWYQGPNFVSTDPIPVISSKNIYGADNNSFGVDAGLAFAYPTAAASNDIEIHFFNGINNTGARVQGTGGYSGNPYTYSLKTTTLNGPFSIAGSGNPYVEHAYEVNNYTISLSDAEATLDFWSGLNVVGKLKDDTIVVSTDGENRIVVDGNGNIAYNDATIPSDLDSSFKYEFRCLSSNAVNAGGDTYRSTDIYLSSSGWKLFNQGGSTFTYTIIEASSGGIVEFTGQASGSGVVTIRETKRTDNKGNIAYNGARIPSGLSDDMSYQFWPLSCKVTDDTTGSSFELLNAYPIRTAVHEYDFYSQEASGGVCGYRWFYTFSNTAKSSTLSPAVQDQLMIMTTSIPWA
jgi:hypothetical protein